MSRPEVQRGFTLNKEEAYWYDETLMLLKMADTYGIDLGELQKQEAKIRKGFISDYQKFPASELRKFIVEASMYSERKRLKLLESRQRARS